MILIAKFTIKINIFRVKYIFLDLIDLLLKYLINSKMKNKLLRFLNNTGKNKIKFTNKN